ncbi:SDR family oxidoreductase [Pseudonocardiaceae bacterium YIM PH 21723]|nr:SDR family oxidoreductase [Pseudonocardiaceae bacterium YIM PH 21723]
MDDLGGQTAVVTGGARGIGHALAEGLAKKGVHLALIATRPQVHETAAQLAAEHGVRALGVECDVADSVAVDAAFDRIQSELGQPTILINNAGIALHQPAVDTTDEQWRRIMGVNLDGVFYASRAFARQNIAAGRKAAIVNISSMSGRIVNIPQQQTAYNVSKAAVDMLTKSLAIEWVEQGIRVNGIAPGYIRSEMTDVFLEANPEKSAFWHSRIPSGDMGRPTDLVDAALYLCSSASRYMVGETIVIDGGYSIV